jgi:prolactin regulatory element-binding protein
VNLLVYTLKTGSSEKGKERASSESTPATALELLRTVERPALPGNFAGSNFRAARFAPGDSTTLYTIINTVPPRTRTKASPRVAFVCKWDTEKWEVAKIRKVGEKGATCFDVR